MKKDYIILWQEVDMNLYWSNYPLNGNFKSMPIVNEQQLIIASAYNMSRMGLTQDIIHMFATYSQGIWLSIFGVFVTMVTLLAAGRWILENKKNPIDSIWIISMFALDEDYLVQVNNFVAIFTIFLSFFCFFIAQCLLNGMSTDMVVIPDPVAVRSFQDLIRLKHVSPAFFKQSAIYSEFKNSTEGTVEWKVWQKGLKLERLRKKPFLLDFKLGKLLQRMDDFVSQKIAAIGDSTLLEATAGYLARSVIELGLYPDMRILLAFSGKKHSSIFALSPYLEDHVYSSIFRRVRRYVESGMFIKLEKRIQESINPFSPSISEMYSDRIKRHPHDMTIEIRLENIKKTLNLLGWSSLIALIALSLEIIRKPRKIKRKKKKGRKRKPIDRLNRN